MAFRIFNDGAGVLWTVWDVVPGAHNPGTRHVATLPEEMSAGWLCFESQAGKRRLYPIPPGWEELSDDRLELLCRAAVPAVPAGRPRAPDTEPPAPPSAGTHSEPEPAVG